MQLVVLCVGGRSSVVVGGSYLFPSYRGSVDTNRQEGDAAKLFCKHKTTEKLKQHKLETAKALLSYDLHLQLSYKTTE